MRPHPTYRTRYHTPHLHSTDGRHKADRTHQGIKPDTPIGIGHKYPHSKGDAEQPGHLSITLHALKTTNSKRPLRRSQSPNNNKTALNRTPTHTPTPRPSPPPLPLRAAARMQAQGPNGFAREDLCVVSYNVRGLNVREKRTRLLRDLKHYKATIAFIQETHFQEGRAPALKDRNYPIGYFSHNQDRRTLGVCILFSRRVPYEEQATVRCKQGRYIFTKGKIMDQTYTFANIYAPNTKQHHFLRRALTTLMKFAEGTLIIGGDLNLAIHPDQDSTSAHGHRLINRSKMHTNNSDTCRTRSRQRSTTTTRIYIVSVTRIKNLRGHKELRTYADT
ncbi:Hypothetical predicted protein [Pelobates cultripes]|uniref:exodeoxyribonuclease III n=1 Tax=Pelobates cultripes TaxID=61616 RepID=A0AAD1SKN9_PELCU|nr:Hypothetical predicted protein [Pelobates cultripes]